ncbi:MAG: CRTAC1 family protein, partial [Saprospiraceae bacterium]|nr:CRTAC1 family protein [Saprospiraceae bacterium]
DNSFGVAFGDYDRDGFLDLYVCNYSENDSSRLYRNNGDVTFSYVTMASGTAQTPHLAFQAAFLDYNNDQWPDIFVAVDKLSPNVLFRNNGDGTFDEVSAAAGVDYIVDAMNAGFGDCNNDGFLDIYVTNGPAGNLLHVNNGDGTFTESAVDCGVALNMNSWGGVFMDCNNDRLLDLYVNSDHFGAVNNGLFVNQDSCQFVKWNGNYSGNAEWSHGTAVGDFDSDGQPDLMINQANGSPYMLLRNNSAPAGTRWLKVVLHGKVSNRDGVGAWIRVYTDTVVQSRFTHAGYAYLAQNSYNIHFGIDTVPVVDSLIVHWPSGVIDKLYGVAADQIVSLTENALIWNGSTDSDWSNPANWDGAVVPDTSDNVFLRPGAVFYPELSAGNLGIGGDAMSPAYLCKSLWIEEGAQMTCQPGVQLFNTALIDIAGTLIVHATGTDAIVNQGGGELMIRSGGTLQVQD